MEDKSQNLHAIFIPYPLQGHVIPAVHLAMKLASQGFTITFINTHHIHHQICKANPRNQPDIFARVREPGLMDIRYTTVSDGLPIEFDRSLNRDQFMAALLHVFSAHVEEKIAQIVTNATESVCCLVADTFFVWPSKIAKKFGLVYVSFWTESALVFTLYYHMDLLRLNRHFDCADRREDIIDYIPGVEAIKPNAMPSYLQEKDTSSMCHQLISKAFDDVKGADFILCNIVQEFEPETITALQSNLRFYPIGPVFPNGFNPKTITTSLWSETECTQWLNKKPHGSVLYISFGSYAHINKSDLVEIAQGISLSRLSFIWVVRDDIVRSGGDDPLPVGFREMVSGRGMIVSWCCQMEVLSHPAVGGFLSHCGWNSVLESIWFEVPMLCFPLLTDQFTNRKLVVDDWKIGLNLSDKELVVKEDVATNVVRLMMSANSRDELMNSIKEKKNVMENALKVGGSSERNMKQFVNDLKSRK